MMKSAALLLWLCFVSQFSWSQTTFSTSSFKLALNDKGRVTSLLDKTALKEYLYSDTTTVLLRMKTKGQWELPVSMKVDKVKGVLTFQFPAQITLEVEVKQTENYITFEITGATSMNQIDRVLWGSFSTTIHETVGEIIGVVRNKNFAIGIQALNLKTTGGYPFNDEGYDASRGSAAIAKKWGSVLQAYSINRAMPRRIDVWNGNFQKMPVVPLPNETILGSKIALFGVPENKALETIGKIEVAEGLPHPMYKGEWIKQSAELGRSYIISNFTEDEVDEMIRHTRRAGLMSLYHEGPFKTWGTYEFNPKYFPHGIEGVKQAVRKTKEAGLHFGVHTLTNFINTHDPYVSPIPDPRLVKTGNSKLVNTITATEKEIVVPSPEYFNDEKNNFLHTIQIGNELIRYRTVTNHAPYTLIDCQRGAFNTQATAHQSGSDVSKLLDHPYEVFFPSIAMQEEIAKNLALLFNETGIDHMDFDGHEGGVAAGQGDFGIESFSKTFYDQADHFVVNGTSNSKHFYWHMNTYCNWGEPWYGGFRESMQEYRIANQALFERNYMPNMMGWYLMTATTSLAEMEWMLARAAGYNAGFAMVLRVRDAQKNPHRDRLLDAIREWEKARRTGAFSDAQRERLQNPKNEFHLEKVSERAWQLFPFHFSDSFHHEKKDLQPGEPTHSIWKFTSMDVDQTLQFTLEVTGNAGVISNPVLTLDQVTEISLPVTLKAGELLVGEDATLRIYDDKGRQRTLLQIEHLPTLKRGDHTLKFNTTYLDDENTPVVRFIIRTLGEGEVIRAN